jgi:hypothetical protein
MAGKTLILNCDSYTRMEKNEDGDKVKRRYRRGDKVSVTNAVSETLLELEVGGRKLFVESKDDVEKEEENVVRTDVGATDPRAGVKAATLTNATAPKSAK